MLLDPLTFSLLAHADFLSFPFSVLIISAVAPPSKHLTTPMGLAKVTSRVRTNNRLKVEQRTGEGCLPGAGQMKWEKGSVVSETERGTSDGSVASTEGSDAGLAQGGSSSICSISYDHKIPSLPLAGLAALPFGADGAALPPPPPPPGVRRSTS